MNPNALLPTIERARQELIDAITPLLPKEQSYVDWHLPHCAGIKYLDADGTVGTYEAYPHQLKPQSFTDLKLENLCEFHVRLVAWSEAKKVQDAAVAACKLRTA